MRIRLALIGVSIAIGSQAGALGPIPPEAKTAIAFLYVADAAAPGEPDRQPTANGTAFFVGLPSAEPGEVYLYLVTAKHVLQNDKGGWYAKCFVRLNRKKGGSVLVPLSLRFEGQERNVFLHPTDESVDLAVIPFTITAEEIEFTFIPQDLLTSREQFRALGMREGDEVFFAGLFTPHAGLARNVPIVRFGRVAMASEEVFTLDTRVTTGFLVDSPSFGGNSGSPLFASLLGRSKLVLAGIVLGTFLDFQPIKVVSTGSTTISQSSMGISIVAPAYKLHEILFGQELGKGRAP